VFRFSLTFSAGDEETIVACATRAEVFDYIEMFYNPRLRHGSNGGVSPVEFEARYAQSGS
jgi:hypothetical protein